MASGKKSSKKSTPAKKTAKRATRTVASNGASKKKSSTRELIDSGTDKRYVRRGAVTGRFVEATSLKAFRMTYDRLHQRKAK